MNIIQSTQPMRWTEHARQKMRFYGLSENRLKRVLRHPTRVEHGIAPATTALMQPATVKHTSEIWIMVMKRRAQLIVITAWRYPGKSPIRGNLPVPIDIQRAISGVLMALG